MPSSFPAVKGDVEVAFQALENTTAWPSVSRSIQITNTHSIPLHYSDSRRCEVHHILLKMADCSRANRSVRKYVWQRRPKTHHHRACYGSGMNVVSEIVKLMGAISSADRLYFAHLILSARIRSGKTSDEWHS